MTKPIDNLVDAIRTIFRHHAVEKVCDYSKIDAVIDEIEHARDRRVIDAYAWFRTPDQGVDMDDASLLFDLLGVDIYYADHHEQRRTLLRSGADLYNDIVLKLGDLGILLADTPFLMTISPVWRENVQAKLEAAADLNDIINGLNRQPGESARDFISRLRGTICEISAGLPQHDANAIMLSEARSTSDQILERAAIDGSSALVNALSAYVQSVWDTQEAASQGMPEEKPWVALEDHAAVDRILEELAAPDPARRGERRPRP